MYPFDSLDIVLYHTDVLKDKVECYVPIQVVRMAYKVKIIENDEFYPFRWSELFIVHTL